MDSKKPGEIAVTWQLPDAGRTDAAITSYAIYYACGSTGEMRTDNIGSTARKYTLTGLGHGMNCSVDVIATNNLGNSSPRNLPQTKVVTFYQRSDDLSGTH